jgi:hypothetical protein
MIQPHRTHPLFTVEFSELGTSNTFIDLPIFDTYRIQKKGSNYQTLKVSEDRLSGHQISTFDSPILSDTEQNIGTKNEKMALYSTFSTEKSIGCPALRILKAQTKQ